MQGNIWDQVLAGGAQSTALTPGTSLQFREPEARSIEFRYQPGRAFEDQLQKLEGHVHKYQEPAQSKLREIIEHCKRFGTAESGARRLQEEQERELSPEVEEEAVVERAVPAELRKHELRQDVRTLVTHGRLVPNSNAFEAAFSSLSDTSAAEEFSPSILDSRCGGELLVTRDFADAVKKQPGSKHTSDAYQRPVSYVLTIRRNSREPLADYVVLISPYEAQMLLDQISASEYAALHLYKPRCSAASPALDNLDLYTVSKYARPALRQQVKAALNMFAGQLYFSSYEEYREACRFLGLASEKAKEGWKVAGDGFILHDGTTTGDKSQEHNPVNFLKVLMMKVRRNVEEFEKSHVGRMLEGNLLMPADFEETG